MIDLDGFKAINDQFGQAVGNELLRGLGAAFRARGRATDVLARLSGDEFAVLLPGSGSGDRGDRRRGARRARPRLRVRRWGANGRR